MKTLSSPLLLAACILLARPLCGGDASELTIDQKDKAFSQTEVTLKPGEKVVFRNSDTVTHNVFSNSKVNPFQIKIQQPGSSSTVQFDTEGVTEVRCAIHPKMKLIVTVKN
jgi:plastocyanin